MDQSVCAEPVVDNGKVPDQSVARVTLQVHHAPCAFKFLGFPHMGCFIPGRDGAGARCVSRVVPPFHVRVIPPASYPRVIPLFHLVWIIWCGAFKRHAAIYIYIYIVFFMGAYPKYAGVLIEV